MDNNTRFVVVPALESLARQRGESDRLRSGATFASWTYGPDAFCSDTLAVPGGVTLTALDAAGAYDRCFDAYASALFND